MEFNKDKTYFPENIYYHKEKLIEKNDEDGILNLLDTMKLTQNQLAELAADCCEHMPDMLTIIIGIVKVDMKTSIHPQLGIPLFTAIATVGDYVSIELAILKGADVNYAGDCKIPPLLQAAAFHRSNDIIELLLKNGADPNATLEDKDIIDCYRSNIDSDLLDYYEDDTMSLMKLCIEYGMKVPV